MVLFERQNNHGIVWTSKRFCLYQNVESFAKKHQTKQFHENFKIQMMYVKPIVLLQLRHILSMVLFERQNNHGIVWTSKRFCLYQNVESFAKKHQTKQFHENFKIQMMYVKP